MLIFYLNFNQILENFIFGQLLIFQTILIWSNTVDFGQNLNSAITMYISSSFQAVAGPDIALILCFIMALQRC